MHFKGPQWKYSKSLYFLNCQIKSLNQSIWIGLRGSSCSGTVLGRLTETEGRVPCQWTWLPSRYRSKPVSRLWPDTAPGPSWEILYDLCQRRYAEPSVYTHMHARRCTHTPTHTHTNMRWLSVWSLFRHEYLTWTLSSDITAIVMLMLVNYLH